MKAPSIPSRRSHIRAASAALVAAGAFAVAACGGDSSTAVEGTAADYIPAGAPLYIEASADMDGPQWDQVRELGARFPGYGMLEAQVNDAVGSEGLDFDEDVRPLLGERAAVAATSAAALAEGAGPEATPDTESFIGVVDLADDARVDMEALLTSEGAEAGEQVEGATLFTADETTHMAVNDDVMVVADTRALVEEALAANASGGDATLAGSEEFGETLGNLPDEVFGLMYADAGSLAQAGGDALQSAAPVPGLGDLEDGHVAAAMIAEPGGLRIQGVTRGVDAYDNFTPFSPELAANAPADALLYAEVADISGVIRGELDTVRESADPDTARQIDGFASSIPGLLGVGVDQLAALGDGRQALIAVPGAEMPGVVFLSRVGDGAQAQATLDGIREATPALLGLLGDAGPATPASPWQQVDIPGGGSGWQLPLDAGVGVTYAVDGDLVALGSAPAAVGAVLNPSGGTLADSDAFAASTEGMPDEVTSLSYVDLAGVVAAADALGALAGAPPEVRGNLEPMRSIAYWDTGGDEATFETFIRIE